MEGVYNEIGVGELIMRGGSCEGSDGKAGGLTSGPFALLHRMSIVINVLYTNLILEAISKKNSWDQIDKLSGSLTKGSTSLRAWSTSKLFIA